MLTTIKLASLATKLANTRLLHSSTIRVSSAKQSPLYKLRQKTGLTYSLCREALNKHNDDMDQAEAWLQAQALALGLQKAGKVGSRSTREGLLSLAIDSTKSKTVTVFEVNCETDFVSKNQMFREFVLDLTEEFVSKRKECLVGHSTSGKNYIQELTPSSELLMSLNDKIVPLISKLGENIKIHRAVHFECINNDALLFGHVHPLANQKEVGNMNFMAGRFGALVGLTSNKLNQAQSSPSLASIGNRLCRHIIGYSPTYIELPDDIRHHMEAIEKEKMESEARTLNAKQVQNNAENKEEFENVEEDLEYDEEDSKRNERDDWPSIMDQTLIMSDDTLVRDFCSENGITIVYMNRFECGLE